MSVDTIFSISILGVLFVFYLYLTDTLQIVRDVLKQKLYFHEKFGVIFFCITTLNFGIFGYAHFHEKDRRQSLKEFKKFSFYRDFFVCHFTFAALMIFTNPQWLWECLSDWKFCVAILIGVLPFSVFFATLSVLIQLPNFFDRHQTIDNF